MGFLNPILLQAGLACVAVPILIHILMRRRRRPIAWGAMRFVIEAARRQRRRVRFEQWLLLAARCLVVALAALAVGRPSSGAGVAEVGPRTLWIVLDHGLASSTTPSGGTGSDLDRSKDAARRLLETLRRDRGDRAALVLAGGPPQALITPPTTDLDAVRDAIDRVQPIAAASDLAGALDATRALIADETRGARIALLSGFRAGSLEASERVTRAVPSTGGATGVVALLPARETASNVAIASIDVLRPILGGGTSEEGAPVRVALVRSGTLDAGTSAVRLEGEGIEPILVSVAWAAGQERAEASAVVVPSATTRRDGVREASLVVRAAIDGGAIGLDDRAWRAIPVRERAEAVIIAPTLERPRTPASFGGADWLALALEPGSRLSDRGGASPIRVTVVSPSAAAAPGTPVRIADVVFVPDPSAMDAAAWGEIARARERGATVFLTASPDADGRGAAWTGALVDALLPGWSFPASATFFAEPVSLSPERAVLQRDPLSLLGPELTELLRPIAVLRALAPTAAPGATTVLSLRDGTPLLLWSAPESGGSVFYLATALELSWTDLPAKPLMVPLVQEIVRQGLDRAGSSAVVVAGAAPDLPAGATEVVFRGEGEPESISAARGAPAITRPGPWAVRDATGATVGIVTVDPDVRGSDVDLEDEAGVRRWFERFAGVDAAGPMTESSGNASGDSAGGAGGGVEFVDPAQPQAWEAIGAARSDPAEGGPWVLALLAAASLLAIVEVVLARRFSHADADTYKGITR